MTKVWWPMGWKALTLALALLEGNNYPAKHLLKVQALS